jgi:hypothetical protein
MSKYFKIGMIVLGVLILLGISVFVGLNNQDKISNDLSKERSISEDTEIPEYEDVPETVTTIENEYTVVINETEMIIMSKAKLTVDITETTEEDFLSPGIKKTVVTNDNYSIAFMPTLTEGFPFVYTFEKDLGIVSDFGNIYRLQSVSDQNGSVYSNSKADGPEIRCKGSDSCYSGYLRDDEVPYLFAISCTHNGDSVGIEWCDEIVKSLKLK